jgi:DNA-binding response OmpR family regulator
MKKIKILLIEDNSADVRLIKEYLREGNNTSFHLEQAERLTRGLDLLNQKKYDIILLDLSLPDSEGSATIKDTLETAPKAPIIVLTGRSDETFAIKAVRKGAQDYLVKGQFGGKTLIRSIKYAIERKDLQEQLKESEERAEFYKDIISHDMNTFLKDLLSSLLLLNLYVDKPKIFIDNPKNSDNLRELLNIIGDKVYRAISVVSNVEELSKLQSLEESMEKLDLEKIILESLDFIKRTLKGKKVEIHENFSDENYYIWGNELVSNVFEIIFYNSVKYNKNTTVKIYLNATTIKKDNSDYFKIEINDNGRGIKDLDEKKSFGDKGVGKSGEINHDQGLSLAQKIVENHKGKLYIEEKANGASRKNSKYVILFPKYTQK